MCCILMDFIFLYGWMYNVVEYFQFFLVFEYDIGQVGLVEFVSSGVGFSVEGGFQVFDQFFVVLYELFGLVISIIDRDVQYFEQFVGSGFVIINFVGNFNMFSYIGVVGKFCSLINEK